MLQNCLPDGGCFTRSGSTVLGGRTFGVLATGYRTGVGNVYFKNSAQPVGEEALLDGLAQ